MRVQYHHTSCFHRPCLNFTWKRMLGMHTVLNKLVTAYTQESMNPPQALYIEPSIICSGHYIYTWRALGSLIPVV